MKPHLKRQWVISKLDSEFIARMEHILYLYHLPYNEDEPIICFDERPSQLLGDVLVPLPMKPGRVKKQHYGYKRNGTCCVLAAFEPLKGTRFVQVYEKRTKIEYAQFMKCLIQQYPNAKRIHIIQDNLRTHTKGAFYKAFDPQIAFQMAHKMQFHFTPVKASWLNMIEIELSVLARRCLNRRIPSMDLLTKEVEQLVKERNEARASVSWQFTVNDARTKFKKQYSQNI